MAARKNKADEPEELPEHVKPLMRTMRDGTRVQSTAPDGTLMYRVRVRDPLTHNQIERHAAGIDKAKDIVKELTEGKRPKAVRDKLTFHEKSAVCCGSTNPMSTRGPDRHPGLPRFLSRRFPRPALSPALGQPTTSASPCPLSNCTESEMEISMAQRKKKDDDKANGSEKLPKGITPLMRTLRDGSRVHAHAADGTPMYRVRPWDPILKRQVERAVKGLELAKQTLADSKAAQRSSGASGPERVKFYDVCVRYLKAYQTKRDGTPRPLASVRKEITYLNCYILPVLGNAWIGELDLPDLYDTIDGMTLANGQPAAPSTKAGAASVLRRVFAWARTRRIITSNPALELTTGWGTTMRRRIVIPSIPR